MAWKAHLAGYMFYVTTVVMCYVFPACFFFERFRGLLPQENGPRVKIFGFFMLLLSVNVIFMCDNKYFDGDQIIAVMIFMYETM